MIQPLSLDNIEQTDPGLHQVGCLGKIISFKETENSHYLIELKKKFNYSFNNCGHSSVVERLVANEKVEGSTPFARSKFVYE